MSKEFIESKLPKSLFLNHFGCYNFESEVYAHVVQELMEGKLPSFAMYNDPARGHCSCRSDACNWNEAFVMKRLTKRGVWAKVIETYAEITSRIPHGCYTRDRAISIFGISGVFPYIGEFSLYSNMQLAMPIFLDCCPKGYVCRVSSDDPERFLLVRRSGVTKIQINQAN